MKQAEDHKTMDLLEAEKRGRGRPRRGDALSDAQRAQRYRENKKARPVAIKRDAVTENRPASPSSGLPSYGMLECRIILLNADNMLLADKLQDALDKIAALEKALMQASALNVTRHGKSAVKKSARSR